MNVNKNIWLVVVLLCTAALPAALFARSDCPPGQTPQAISTPAPLTTLPLSINQPSVLASGPERDALDRVATSFASRAPAWSLAVASSSLGLWETQLGAEPTDRFAAASIGKSMTAVLVFQAIEAGALKLTDTIETWFPGLPMADEVSIEHLLTHRSGYFVLADGPLSGPYRAPEAEFEKLKSLGLAFCPGQGWAYSNVGYQLLGRILEAVNQLDYATLVTQRIIEPLSLEHTHVLVPGVPDQRMVRGHQGGQAVEPVDYASAFSAAPVSSTAGDLLRYWQALLSGQLISKASLERMVNPAWPMFGNLEMRYGAGIQVAEITEGPGQMLMHSGGITGFSATVAWLADHDLWVAVMANERQVPAEAALWALVRALNASDGPD